MSSAYAQTTPDAGTLRQQIEQQLPQALPGEKKPLTALPPEYKPAPGLAVTVKQFRFDGITLLTADALVGKRDLNHTARHASAGMAERIG